MRCRLTRPDARLRRSEKDAQPGRGGIHTGGAGAPAPKRAIADPACTLPGRGAYLCRDRDRALPVSDCLARATRRGGIARALRAKVTLDPKLVESL